MSPNPKIPRQPLRVGFVGLTDCAPLAVAKEKGFFARHGLQPELSREIGWATIRDKILYGELEAAQAPAGMLLAAAAGLYTLPANCVTGLVLNLQGNAIVLSQRLAKMGVTDGHKLREHLRRRRERLTLGVVYHWSSHHVLLRQWLRDHGIDSDRDAQVVIVPPSQVYTNLRAGHLDGYCVGEPWAALAVVQRAGFVVARSAELAPLHPEKVLMVRGRFAERAQHDHLALIASLLEACAWCDAPGNREELVEILARPEYVNAPVEALRMSLGGRYNFGLGRVEDGAGANIFFRNEANVPSAARAAWVLEGFCRAGLASAEQLPKDLGARCFRADIHAQARALLTASRSSAA